MSDTSPLIGILSGGAPAPERRRALREAALDEDGLRALVDAALARRSDDPDAARQIAASALAASRAAVLPETTVFAARVLAQTHIVQGKPKSALRLLRRHGPAGGPTLDASVTLELAQTLSMLGLRAEALLAIEECRERMPASGAEYPLALLDAAEASLLHGAGHVEQALDLLERARPALIAHGNRVAVASLDGNRANLLSSLARYEEAEVLYREAAAELESFGQHAAALHARFGLAEALMRRGLFHAALRQFDRVRGEFSAGQNDNHVAACKLVEAEINLALNLPSQAWRLALEARATFESLAIRDELAKADFIAALAARGLGRTVESLHRLEAAYRVFSRPGGCASDAALCLYRLAEADREVQESGRGAQRAARAHDALRGLGWHERAGRAAVLLAEFETEAGELELARERLVDLLVGAHPVRTAWVRCEVYHKLGLVEEMLGDRWRAALNVLRATRLLERYRVTVPPDEYMAAFLTGRVQLFDDAIRIVTRLAGRGVEARAFELSEQARARALLDLIRNREVRGEAAPQDDVAHEVGMLERRLQGVSSLPSVNEARHDAVAARRIEAVSEGEARLKRCLDQLALEDPERAREMRGAPVRLRSLSERLPEDETLIEFFLSEHEFFVFVVDRTGVAMERRALDSGVLRKLMSRLRFHLDRPRVEDRGDDEQQLRSAVDVLEDLNALLLGGIRERIRTRRIVIVPHGMLHGVPFPALSLDGRPLIEDHEVLIAPSAAIYLHCLARPHHDRSGALFLGVDDDRPTQAAAEIEALAELVPGARVFAGDRATAAVLEREGRDAGVVHLAARTEYRHDDPMQSRIRLSDGWLTIPKLYDIELAPELLVLSGSASGRVAVTQGGDLFGLVRGFLHAGVPTLLTSLWEVSDERTREYMERFYGAFVASGGRASEAHRRATLEIRALHPHPYNWAPFLLTGRAGGKPHG